MADREPPAYLDYNATAPLLPEVKAAIAAHLDIYGNPSSVHSLGRQARGAMERARDAVAVMVAVKPEHVIFTSGGTEANALALRGIAQIAGAAETFVSSIEHASVRTSRGPAKLIAVDATGVIDLRDLEQRLAATNGRALVAVMLANNETGVIQPIASVVEIARKHGALIHCDAVQAPGRMAVNMQALGVDSLTLSAHKLGGPKGVGALVLRPGVDIDPLYLGGGQERMKRVGTENLLGIVGFGAAAEQEARLRATAEHVRHLREALESAILQAVPQARIHGRTADRLPNTTCVSLPGVSSEIQLMRLDLAGVAVSAGSACSSGKIAASHVLLAMGVPESEAKCAIRVSLGWGTTAVEPARFLEVWRGLASNAAA